MSELNIHDFIENYPLQNDEDIQWKTACRREFNLLKSSKNKISKTGRFFNHQELILRYIRQYDRIFNIHGTGTGKSGSIINAAEYYKKNENMKRVYVLEPGPPTVEDFKKQIVKLSNPDEYVNENTQKASNEKALKNNLTRLIQTWYSVETYNQFASLNLSDEEIVNTYSDCIFFLDEAHKYKNLTDDAVIGKDSVYDYLWKVLHLAKRIKIIVSSATPMINSTKDFVPLLNLLLPMDFQLPLKVDDNFYDRVTLSQLEPFFRGKITFIKFLESNINIIREGRIYGDYVHEVESPQSASLKGIPLKNVEKTIKEGFIITTKDFSKKDQELVKSSVKKYTSQAHIYSLPMKSVQLKTYILNSKDTKNFSFNPRQTSVFTFPDGSIGKNGFTKYTEVDKFKNYKFVKEVYEKGKVLPGLGSFLKKNDPESSLKNLDLLSCKFKFYIEKEFTHSKEPKPGNSFCYIEFVESSGAILLGMIMKYFGFDEYKSINNPFDIKTKKLVKLEKGKRFALLTGQTTNTQNIIDVFNSPENIDGEYIQIIIASQMARDGINLRNVLRGYIMTPGWHESGMYQALSRFIRADSHNDLIKRNGGEKIDIRLYRLAAVVEEKEKCLYNKKNIISYSVDIDNYLKSEEKDIKIKRILRFMKQTSFDAYMNYERNTNIDSPDFTSQNDYEKKYFKIWKSEGLPFNKKRTGLAYNQGPSRSEYVYNTYNLFYVRSSVNLLKKKLTAALNETNFVIVTDFLKSLKEENIQVNNYIFTTSLEELIYNKEIFRNNENTISYNAKINGHIIYRTIAETNYNNRLSTENFSYINMKYMSLNKKDEDVNIYNENIELLEKMTKKQIIEYYIEKQDYLFFKYLIEKALLNKKNNELSKLDKNILELFDNYIIITKEPENYLKEAKIALSTENKSGQGRNRAEGSTAGLKYLNLDKKDPGYNNKEVYTHFYRDSEKTGFGITSILEGFGRKIRILQNNEFLDANDGENFVYNYLFDLKYKKIMAPYKKAKYYATYICRGNEDEKNIAKKKRNFIRLVNNENPKSKGQVCRTEKTENIIKILKYIDTNKKYKNLYDGKEKKDYICEKIKDLMEEKGLLFFSL